ncbi:MFS general substrate transporter [Neolentinus lepideus HHB14362 ss-1]|uniref:MFS general substrate transporter n=1 Tax=Neolentinus lepideus HHB14362 ss-1 TaxID=1314782 RepID=A0A165SM03_9AGAM|nr:MFS general substrate transporter [Neolentinus lepideus HHB14362 ss-1]
MQSYLAYRRFASHPDVLRARDREQNRAAASPSNSMSAGPTRVPSRDEEIADLEEDAERQSIPGASREPVETSELEKEDPYLVAWTHGDPENPHNWSDTRRWLVTFLIGQIALVAGVAPSIDQAAAGDAAPKLGVSTEVLSLETAVFLFGFGIAGPLFAPLSEIGGRNPVYIITLLMFVLFEGGIALSNTIQARVILRFFAGVTGSPVLSNAGGTLSDMWSPLERTFSFPFFAFCGFLGPSLGPVLGGFIGQSRLGYKWADWITAIWALALLVVMILWLPETFAPALLKMKSAAIRRATNNPAYLSPTERHRMQVSFAHDFWRTMARPFILPVLEPIVLLFSLYMTVVYIVLFGSFEAYPLVFAPYNFNAGQTGLTFIPISVGLAAVLAVTPATYKHYRKLWDRSLETFEAEKAKLEKTAEEVMFNPPPPETRLLLAIYGTWLFPISLFWFAWTCYKSVGPWPAIMSGTFFGAGILCCFISSYQYIIDAYESYAASALSSLTLIRYNVSGGAVLWTTPMFKRLGNHWALSLLGFLSILLSFVPWIFYVWGAKIRSWSRYAKHTGDY